MNILVLSPFLPWPLDQGGKIRIYNIVRELSRRHRVTLAALADEPPAAEPLRGLCDEVIMVGRPALLWRDRFSFLFGRDPYNVIRYSSREMEATLRRLHREQRFDLVLVEFSMMWQYARLFPGVPVCLDAHNVEYLIIRQLRESSPPLRRLAYAVEERRLRRREEEAWRDSSRCFTVSDAERDRIAACTDSGRVVTVPNGVDLERFAFAFAPRPGGKKVLFLGGMDYAPNLDAATYFLGGIFPALHASVPDATAEVVGRELGRIPTELAAQPGVTLHEKVPDVLPFFRSADLLAVPLRMGAGTRIKILEAMGAGLPVVSTAKGCEGIAAARHGEHLLVADTPADFTAAAARLLSDQSLRESIAASGRDLVEKEYGWESLVLRMERSLEDSCGGSGTRRR
jgi:polysaccharide biosynthesis protein PslH